MDNSTKATSFQWDDENIARLRTFKESGITATDIATLLGTTKGSVLGKLRRLGLYTPYPNGARKPKAKKGKAFAAGKRELLAKNGNPHLPPGTVPLLELKAADCRWPVTDRPPHLFCGRERWGTSSYCCQHTAKAWRRGI